MSFTNSFSISSFGSSEIAADVITGGTTDGYVRAIFINNDPVDPTSSAWKKIATSDELKFIVNQFNGTINQPVKFLSDEELLDYYELLAKSLGSQGFINADNLNRAGRPSSGGRNPSQLPRAVGKKQRKRLTSALSYPIDIDKNQDYLQIDQFEYRAPQGGFGSGLSNPTRSKKFGGTVILPMPKVSDSNGAEWGKNDLNIFGVAATSAVGSLIPKEDGTELDSSAVSNILGNLKQNAPGGAAVGGAMVASGLAAKAGLGINLSADQLLARSSGNITNPNAELLFTGPTLRNFSFSYTMVARNEKEGANIRRIIKFFKDGLAPKKLSDALLATPNIFALKYNTKNGNKSVNKFKDMALQRFTVDYAPSGFWTAYDDSQPVAVQIQFEFTELQPIYNTDQAQYTGDDVGY